MTPLPPVCMYKTPSVCRFKTSPCVPAPRAHVETHVCAWCRHTRGRFECTHGDVFESRSAASMQMKELPLVKPKSWNKLATLPDVTVWRRSKIGWSAHSRCARKSAEICNQSAWCSIGEVKPHVFEPCTYLSCVRALFLAALNMKRRSTVSRPFSHSNRCDQSPSRIIGGVFTTTPTDVWERWIDTSLARDCCGDCRITGSSQ